MKILVPINVKALRDAKNWLNRRESRIAVESLENWLSDSEVGWGSCTVFVETHISRGGYTEQLDLLVAFADRALICEIKGGLEVDSLFPYHFQKAAVQIDEQKKLVQRIVQDAGNSATCVRACMVMPRLGCKGIEHAVMAKIALKRGDFSLCGVREELRNATVDDLYGERPLYWSSVAEYELGRAPSSVRARDTVSNCLFRAIEEKHKSLGHELRELSGFNELQDLLSREVQDVAVAPHREYVHGLRQELVLDAIESLHSNRLIEVVGSQGVGKTEFTREVLRDFEPIAERPQMALPPLVVVEKRTVASMLIELARHSAEFDMSLFRAYSETAQLEELLRAGLIFWIRDYDAASAAAIEQLQANLRHYAADGNSYWIFEIVESSEEAGVAGAASAKVYLPSLGSSEIAIVLERYTRSRADFSVANIVEAARGNLWIAISLWQRGIPNELRTTDSIDRYGVFEAGLPRDARLLLSPLAYIIKHAPLGCTAHLAEQWCKLSAIGDVGRLLRTVLTEAQDQGFIAIDGFGSKSVPGQVWSGGEAIDDIDIAALKSALLPLSFVDARISWINIVDPHFVDYFEARVSDAARASWNEQLGEVFSDTRIDLSLAGVSFELLTGSFAPFVRSSFCTSASMIPRLKDWLDRPGNAARFGSDSEDFRYFRQWLSWVGDHYYDDATQAAPKWILTKPSLSSDVQKTLYDNARTRGFFYYEDGQIDLDTWAETAEKFKKSGQYDLWGEATVRRAETIFRAPYNDPAGAWALLESVLAEEEHLSPHAGRGSMYFHVLSFFNRHKGLNGKVKKLTRLARSMTLPLAQKMIDAGYETENLVMIANAVFFAVRLIEGADKTLSSEDADDYAAIMRFVQKVSLARRVQGLLTEGTAHRYCCMRADIAWVDFERHADEALSIYDRTRDAALHANMYGPVVNSLGYSSLLVLRSLEFRERSELLAWLDEVVPRLISGIERANSRVDFVREFSQRKSNERKLIVALHFDYFFLIWLVEAMHPSQGERLEIALAAAVDALGEFSTALSHGEAVVTYQARVEDVSQFLVSASAISKHHGTLLTRCAKVLSLLVEDALWFCPKGTAKRESSRLFKAARELSAMTTAL
jgi:hypothetical protein